MPMMKRIVQQMKFLVKGNFYALGYFNFSNLLFQDICSLQEFLSELEEFFIILYQFLVPGIYIKIQYQPSKIPNTVLLFDLVQLKCQVNSKVYQIFPFITYCMEAK